MSPVTVEPELLFPMVRRLERRRAPEPWIGSEPLWTGCDTTGLVERISREVKEPFRFYPGTCSQLARNLEGILRELLTNVAICEERDILIVPRFSLPTVNLARLGQAMKRIFADFLMATPEYPGAVWAFSLCWTDRFILRLFGATLFYKGTRYRSYEMSQQINMKFRKTGQWPIRIAAGLLNEDCWLPPKETCWSDRKVLRKICQEISVWKNAKPQSSVWREQLGIVIESDKDNPMLACCIHPAQRGKSRSVWQDSAGQFLLAEEDARQLTSEQGSSLGKAVPFDWGTAKRIDPIGVLDVYIVKANRYIPWPLWEHVDLVQFDELAFALDRETGRVIYIATTSDVLPYFGQPFEDYAIGRWLLQQRHMHN